MTTGVVGYATVIHLYWVHWDATALIDKRAAGKCAQQQSMQLASRHCLSSYACLLRG